MSLKPMHLLVLVAMMVPATTQAVNFLISGQVNRLIRFADDGTRSDVQSLDNSISGTRLRVRGAERMGQGLTAGVYVEFGVISNSSNSRDIKDADGGDRFGDAIRHSALWFGGRVGKLWFGQTSTATDGVTEADLSGTDVADYVESPGDISGAIVFHTDNGASTGIDVRDVFFNADGGRRDIVKYESPQWGAFRLKGAIGNNEYWDVGATAQGAVAGGSYDVRLGYSSDGNAGQSVPGISFSDDKRKDSFGASAAYRFAQGTNIQVSYSKAELDELAAGAEAEGEQIWAKLGQRFGNNRVAIAYGRSKRKGRASGVAATSKTELDSLGLSFVRVVGKSGVEVYASYARHHLDANAAVLATLPGSPQTLDVVIFGSRIKFD